MAAPTLSQVVAAYGLQPHPEGGFFAEWHRTRETVSVELPERFPRDATRNLLSAIHYALPRGGRSALHRILSDELWAWHQGAPLVVVMVDAAGAVSRVTLGPDLAAGQRVTFVVPASCYFGAFVPRCAGAEFALVSCLVSPGFSFDDWEMKRAEELRIMYGGAKGREVSGELEAVLGYLATDTAGELPAA
jgi:predicted cupin superfamily sugar epimerase